MLTHPAYAIRLRFFPIVICERAAVMWSLLRAQMGTGKVIAGMTVCTSIRSTCHRCRHLYDFLKAGATQFQNNDQDQGKHTAIDTQTGGIMYLRVCVQGSETAPPEAGGLLY